MVVGDKQVGAIKIRMEIKANKTDNFMRVNNGSKIDKIKRTILIVIKMVTSIIDIPMAHKNQEKPKKKLKEKQKNFLRSLNVDKENTMKV